MYTNLFLSGPVSFCILRFPYELKYIWYLILINSPMHLLWQTGSETVFGHNARVEFDRVNSILKYYTS